MRKAGGGAERMEIQNRPFAKKSVLSYLGKTRHAVNKKARGCFKHLGMGYSIITTSTRTPGNGARMKEGERAHVR